MWLVLVAFIFLASPKTIFAADLEIIQNQVKQQVELRQKERAQIGGEASKTVESVTGNLSVTVQAKKQKIHSSAILAQWFNGKIRLHEVEEQLYLSIFR